MTDEMLSFNLIERKVAEYYGVAGDDAGIVERYCTAIAMLSSILLLLLVQFARSTTALLLLAVMALVAVLTMVVALFLFVRREWRTFHHRDDNVSREMDDAYAEWRKLVLAMRRFPKLELSRRLRYLRLRRSGLTHGLGLFAGGVHRLGILPVLAILYLQFKDWRFGDWHALTQIHIVGGLTLWAIFVVYVLSWWMVGLSKRWDTYEALLTEATFDE